MFGVRKLEEPRSALGQIPASRTKVTLLAIKDDFVLRTLASVPGIWGKLHYVAELRENDKYVHWGLARIYGEVATQLALREVHRELFLQVLRTPVRQLVADVVPSAAGKQLELRDFLESLIDKATLLVPPEIGGGSVVHFHSTLAALSLLRARPEGSAKLLGALHRVAKANEPTRRAETRSESGTPRTRGLLCWVRMPRLFSPTDAFLFIFLVCGRYRLSRPPCPDTAIA
jgi:hypothetical protein